MFNNDLPQTPAPTSLSVTELLAQGQESSPIQSLRLLSPSQIDPALRDSVDNINGHSEDSDDEAVNGQPEIPDRNTANSSIRMRRVAELEVHRLSLSAEASQSLYRFASVQ